MVNINEQRRFENEFRIILDENKKSKIKEYKLSGIIANERTKSNIDISKLVSCSNNYYKDLNKIYFENEFVSNISENKKISFSGNGILYLIVEKNCILELEFLSKKFNSSFIKILVKENVKLDIIIFSDSINGWNQIEFFAEENSEVKVSEIIFGAKILHVKANLEKNAKYDLKSAYMLKESESYILNKVTHLGESSISNIDVKGSVISNSKVISEGFVNISHNAKKSIAHQNLKGLILDNTSSISGEPTLEIANSDVKCSHGFSVSQIAEDILFYCSSRGLTKEDAVRLITVGFFSYALENQDELLRKSYLKIAKKKF